MWPTWDSELLPSFLSPASDHLLTPSSHPLSPTHKPALLYQLNCSGLWVTGAATNITGGGFIFGLSCSHQNILFSVGVKFAGYVKKKKWFDVGKDKASVSIVKCFPILISSSLHHILHTIILWMMTHIKSWMCEPQKFDTISPLGGIKTRWTYMVISDADKYISIDNWFCVLCECPVFTLHVLSYIKTNSAHWNLPVVSALMSKATDDSSQAHSSTAVLGISAYR